MNREAVFVTHQVFISYAQADKIFADAVCHRLEEAGVRCWIAPRDISPSKDWAEEIIDAIGTVLIMVLVFSSHSNNSPQVRREVERAVHKGVNILPFRIEDVPPSKSLEYFISSQHWLDAVTDPMDAHLEKLQQCVQALIAGLSPDCQALSMPPSQRAVAEPSPSASPSASPPPAAFSESDLKFVEAQLAGYIGPMAKILVKKASKKAKSLDELTDMLSKELSKESERQSFVSNCQFLNH